MVIEIKDLYKTYGSGENSVEALKGINLQISDGEIFGIIGLSGAGKSSLVRCINLLEMPTSGEILVDGVNLSKVPIKELRGARKKIGMIFQHFNLLMNSTVFDNVAFPLKLAKKDKGFIEKRVKELLELVGLEDKKDFYPAQLSGGQKQRVGIARAIADEPSLIMCDEATSALDPATTKSILELLKEINKKLNMTIIIITHEMDVIRQICDKVAILEQGKIVESGNVIDMYVKPKSKVAQRFFKSVDTELENDVYKAAVSGEGVVVKTIFMGDRSTDPYINDMIKKCNVDVAILLGNIQSMENMLIGTLVIKITGSDENIEGAIKYLKDRDVQVEVLNND